MADWAQHPGLLPPEGGEPRVPNTHANSFEETNLKAPLNAHGVTRLVITGLITPVCVKAAAVPPVSGGCRSDHFMPLVIFNITNALLQLAAAGFVPTRSVQS